MNFFKLWFTHIILSHWLHNNLQKLNILFKISKLLLKKLHYYYAKHYSLYINNKFTPHRYHAYPSCFCKDNSLKK